MSGGRDSKVNVKRGLMKTDDTKSWEQEEDGLERDTKAVKRTSFAIAAWHCICCASFMTFHIIIVLVDVKKIYIEVQLSHDIKQSQLFHLKSHLNPAPKGVLYMCA